MPDAEPVEDVIPRILEQYNERPRGWRVLHTPLGDMLVVGPTSAYQLRLIPLGPGKFTGAGAELDEESPSIERMKATPEYGLRSLTQNDLEDLIKGIEDPELTRPKIAEIIRRSPIPPSDLAQQKAKHYLSGPVLTRPDLTSLSPDITRIQRSLESQAEKVFREKYPMRSGMFF
ncbi:hypothetical protein EU520_00995 [Candidatus Thorarchaeota archaeon]|nr:MAG: hypothetical protein EU520_00995 [Candidatus Thorarchaeota archaeon]